MGWRSGANTQQLHVSLSFVSSVDGMGAATHRLRCACVWVMLAAARRAAPGGETERRSDALTLHFGAIAIYALSLSLFLLLSLSFSLSDHSPLLTRVWKTVHSTARFRL